MEVYDDDLKEFESNGGRSLPEPRDEGYVENEGARIRYSTYGSGLPVILLHGSGIVATGVTKFQES